jgi:hypothetical protein
MNKVVLLSRFIATIPMLTAGVSAVVFGVLAFIWLGMAVLCVFNVLVFYTCSHFYEDTVNAVQEFLVKMAEDIIKDLS